MNLIITVVLEECVGNLCQTESLIVINDQRHDGNTVQDDLADLVGLEGRGGGRRGGGH